LSNSKTSVPDVAIIGGGIIGLLTARELVNAGATVSIYDRQGIGRESSWAGGGILSPLYPWRYPEAVNRLAAWSQRQYPVLTDELLQETGVDPEYLESGLLINASNDLDIGSKWIENHNIPFEILSPGDVAGVQPGVAEIGSDWLWLPEIAQVRNPYLLQSLRQYLLRKEVKIVENTPISEFIIENGKVTGLSSGRETITADRFLLAAGAWSGLLGAEAGLRLKVEPVRGQMLLLNGEPGLLQRRVLSDSHYLIPRRDGRILVGSTLEYVGFDKSVTSEATNELEQAAEAIFPGILGRCGIETQWAGLRPGSPEGIPYIGMHPGIDNLFVCSGHFRNGFVLGPASARLAADLMLEREPVLEPGAYSPARIE